MRKKGVGGRTALQNLSFSFVLCAVHVAKLSGVLKLKLQEIESHLSSSCDTVVIGQVGSVLKPETRN